MHVLINQLHVTGCSHLVSFLRFTFSTTITTGTKHTIVLEIKRYIMNKKNILDIKLFRNQHSSINSIQFHLLKLEHFTPTYVISQPYMVTITFVKHDFDFVLCLFYPIFMQNFEISFMQYINIAKNSICQKLHLLGKKPR